MTDPIKSMAVFFIDNRQAWPENAHLHGNLVLWPDTGKYPTFTPVALAEHPQFDGKIVVQAGNRGIVVSLVAGAQSANDVQKGMSAKGVEQYRIAVDSIIQAIMLMRADSEGGGAAHPISLLTMLRNTPEGVVISEAVRGWLRDPRLESLTEPAAKAFERAEDILEALAPKEGT